MAQPLKTSEVRRSRVAETCDRLRTRHGFVRVLNVLATKVQQRVMPSRVLGMPRCVSIEPTNCCDGGCVLCPVGEGRRSRPIGFMTWNDYVNVIHEVGPYASLVGLYNWGEPLLHARIFDMISYAKAQGVYTTISTNLHAFEASDARRLVRTGLDHLGISLHGASEGTYRTYQPRHCFADVLAKVIGIVKARNGLGSRTPEIRLNFIVRRDNENEAALFQEMAKDLGIEFLLEEVSLNLRFLPYDRSMALRNVSEADLRIERLDRLDKWLPKDQKRVNPFYTRVKECGGGIPDGERLFACTSPWYQMIICWDGDVNLCCGSFRKEDSVGNVLREGVRKVWNGALYQAARRTIARRRRLTEPPIMCAACPGMLL